MALVKIDGIEVMTEPGIVEGFEDIGSDDDDGLIGNVIRQRTRQRRTWRMKVPPQSLAVAAALRMWVEGFGHRWPRLYRTGYASAYSWTGVTTSAISGSVTYYNSAGKWAERARVASAGYAGFRLQNRMGVHRFSGWDPSVDGFTIACQRYWTTAEGVGADGYYHTIITGKTTFARAASANPAGVTQYRNGVAGSYNLGRCFSVQNATPWIALHGYLNTNTNAAIDFSDVLFLPFQLPNAAWASQLSTWANAQAMTDRPKLTLSGDLVDNVPVPVVGRVRNVEQRVGQGATVGAWAVTHRALEIELRETV